MRRRSASEKREGGDGKEVMGGKETRTEGKEEGRRLEGWILGVNEGGSNVKDEKGIRRIEEDVMETVSEKERMRRMKVPERRQQGGGG